MTKYTGEKPFHTSALIEALRSVPDHRSNQGKRFELAYLIGLVLLGFIKGKTSIEACVEFGKARKGWFSKWFDMTHGIPDATTIGRALAVTSASDIIKAVNGFDRSVKGISVDEGVSLDGKTIRAISGLRNGCHHFISLFSHDTCRILDAEGVVSKENEITATPRLLERQCLLGTMLTADALLTQTKITKAVRKSGADYLLVVKANQKYLQNILSSTFTDPHTQTTNGIFHETRRTRNITTTISLTPDLDLDDLRKQGWCDLALVGRLKRSGTRINKGFETEVNEEVFFITSRVDLTPTQSNNFLRNHWHIENKLHWQKDVTLKEDRQRTKMGNAPSILSYLRSLTIQFIKTKYTSVTKAIETFTEKPNTYLNLLNQLQLV